MATRYALFRAVGDRKALALRVKEAVRQSQMAMRIPMMKFEKGSGREFYLGIAVVEDDVLAIQPSPSILQVFRNAGLGKPIGHYVESAAINSSFMSGSIGWEAFNESIKFESDPPEPISKDTEYVKLELDGNTWDKILWWCSAQGGGSSHLFGDSIELLTAPARIRPWTIMRRLLLLGHIEANGIGSRLRWFANRPCFVCTTGGHAYLLGSRTPRFLDELSASIRLSSVPVHGVPSVVSADANQVQANRDCLEQLGISIAQDSAWTWSRTLPLWQSFLSMLQRDPDVRLHSDTFALWDGTRFCATNSDQHRPGLYQITGAANQDVRVRLFDGTDWISGAFYDLRWLSQRIGGMDLKAYLLDDDSLAIQEETRWPLMYERALVLCSGRLPARVCKGSVSFLKYPSVGSDVAQSLCETLGISLAGESLK